MKGKPVFFKLVFPEEKSVFPITLEAEIHARHDDIYEQMTPKITESELDAYIDRLIGELEYIRREGKRKFAATKSKLLQGKPEDIARVLIKKLEKIRKDTILSNKKLR